MVSSLLDRVPRPLRLLPAAASGLLMLSALGKLHLPEVKVDPGVAVAGGVVLAGAASLYVVVGKLARRKPVSVLKGSGRRGWGCRVFAVRAVGGPEAASSLLRALRERASHGRIRYSIHSFLDDGGVATVIVISGRSESVDVEGEILKAMASAVGGIRLEEVDVNELQGLCGVEYPPVRRQGFLSPLMIPDASQRRTGGRGFVVGERLDTPQPTPVKLYEEDIIGHVGVFGSTGSGKSTTAAVIACGVASIGFTPVVADWTGEYARLTDSLCPGTFRVLKPISDRVSIDPLSLASETGDYDLAVEVISQGLGLSGPQEFMLSSIVESRRPASMRELYEVVASIEEASKWDREVKRGLLRKIGILVKGRQAALFRGEAARLNLESPSILRLDEIRVSAARRVYVLLILAWLYASLQEGEGGGIRESSRRVFIIDEAHNVIGEEHTLVETLLSESRKYGLHLVIVTQSPSTMPERVLLNTNTKIAHALKGPRDKAVIANAMSLEPSLAGMLDRLAPGEAILASPSHPEPIPIKVKYVH